MGRNSESPPRMTRRQRRRLGQIHVDQAETDAQREKLNLAIDQAAHATEAIPATPATPEPVNTGDPAADQQPTPSGIRGRGIVRTVALGASTLLGLVIIALQIPAYRSMLGDAATPLEWAGWLNLAILAPMAVEIVAWVYTVMAVLAVANDRPSGRYTFAMWGFSSLAAVVNATHNMSGGQYLTGAVLGGLSIVAPFIVHSALRWDRDALDERTTDQRHQDVIDRVRRVALAAAGIASRAAVGTTRAVLHPLLTVQAGWVSTKYHLAYSVAFQLAAAKQITPYRDVFRDEYANAINERARRVYDVPAATSEQNHATPNRDRDNPNRDTTGTGTTPTGTTGTLDTLDRDTGTPPPGLDRDPNRDTLEQFRRELDAIGTAAELFDTATGTSDRDRDTTDRDSTGTPRTESRSEPGPGHPADRDNRDRDTTNRDHRDSTGTPGPGHRDTPRDSHRDNTPGHPATSENTPGHDATGTRRDTNTPNRDTTGTTPVDTGHRDTPHRDHRDMSRPGSRSDRDNQTGTGTTGTGTSPGSNRDRDTPIGTGTGTAPGHPDESRSASPGVDRDRDTTGTPDRDTDTDTTRVHQDTITKKQLLIMRYYELRDAGTDPMQANFTAEGREFGADRGYVRRVFAECSNGKHTDPRATTRQTG
ncbi:hypothetical protein FHX42_005281 [Saccharopolyspora lacisalsi]|uniref:DUF2637 domain-containing protein n=1 Tax=Halosaccharopolyspora lacisalsi TaxID=1000566 RepID=A0A839E1Z7_9PSEU|nr:DUF2637 domain-containing protein [Halosaccharopolyspora lacisalsi]MBA8827874.1 hypothetical protein [Halosaccharopolyspora lacisalsi]